nr:formate dehydrogenase accessory sulfurtransferase FdhD [Janibacter limosus]
MTQRLKAQRVGDVSGSRIESVAVEEPLEIRVAALPASGIPAGSNPLRPPSTTVTTTMRLPGDDFDLTLGHLVAEGLIGDGEDIATMMHCTDVGPDGSPTFNVVEVTPAAGVSAPAADQRADRGRDERLRCLRVDLRRRPAGRSPPVTLDR